VIKQSTLEMLRRVGFARAVLVPFYGHSYFRKIPGIRDVDRFLTKWAAQKDLTLYASFCFSVAQKAGMPDAVKG
jgi:hypothetical protein